MRLIGALALLVLGFCLINAEDTLENLITEVKVEVLEKCPENCICLEKNGTLVQVMCKTGEENKTVEIEQNLDNAVETIKPSDSNIKAEEMTGEEPQSVNASFENEDGKQDESVADNSQTNRTLIQESKGQSENTDRSLKVVSEEEEDTEQLMADEPIADNKNKEIPENLKGDTDAKIVAKKGGSTGTHLVEQDPSAAQMQGDEPVAQEEEESKASEKESDTKTEEIEKTDSNSNNNLAEENNQEDSETNNSEPLSNKNLSDDPEEEDGEEENAAKPNDNDSSDSNIENSPIVIPDESIKTEKPIESSPEESIKTEKPIESSPEESMKTEKPSVVDVVKSDEVVKDDESQVAKNNDEIHDPVLTDDMYEEDGSKENNEPNQDVPGVTENSNQQNKESDKSEEASSNNNDTKKEDTIIVGDLNETDNSEESTEKNNNSNEAKEESHTEVIEPIIAIKEKSRDLSEEDKDITDEDTILKTETLGILLVQETKNETQEDVIVAREQLDEAMSGKMISDEQDNGNTNLDPRQSTASWVILGLILATFVGVLGYAAIRGRKNRHSNELNTAKEDNNVSNRSNGNTGLEGTELTILSRPLLITPDSDQVREYKDNETLEQVVVGDQVAKSEFPFMDGINASRLNKNLRPISVLTVDLPSPSDMSRNDSIEEDDTNGAEDLENTS